MTRGEVHEKLCVYHPKSPHREALMDGGAEPREPGQDCSCDNCFYGRHRLAVELLKHMDGKAVPPLLDWITQDKDREIIINPGPKEGWVEVQMFQGASCVITGIDTTKPQQFERRIVEATEAQLNHGKEVSNGVS